MNHSKNFLARVSRPGAAFAAAVCVALASFAQTARAADWNQIELLKSRRADVERVLGRPLEDKPGETGTLKFKVAGGTVTVSFVSARFVANKKLSPALEGTVLQVVLQHENARETPDTLNITGNKNFEREERGAVALFRNMKDGIAYTFVNGRLTTTWYSPAAEQLARARTKA